ncbi:CHAD domain-containing protein [Rhizobium sp. 1399]|jgi:inorganic triphosphatase YgiF|uniref:CHAD domain-containing protein n=1 Tax=Rhizobium sp. 1399 TaxID=2817758 RepID=UPI00286313A1|nr:CHAD domain-containing protein [Rhizobium sp. 1399]MDR6668006.1 inorganic triphosphatase YgiF [Rhizobium sp. 1399]
MTAVAAFQAIASSCLRHFRLNEDALLEKRRPEALHQVRVALRRLRSAFSLFKPIVSGDEPVRLNGELRWLAAVLGEARTDHLANSRLLASALPRAQNFAARVLEKKRKRLKKDGKALRRLTATIGTKFRKDAKKFRYAAEFSRSLFADTRGARRHKTLLNAMETLQGRFGWSERPGNWCLPPGKARSGRTSG